MAQSTRVRGEQVKCHECFNIWPREHGGLQCPHCESEFVEILSDSNPPSPSPLPREDFFPDDVRLTRSRSLDSLENRHHPLQNVPDPDEDDIGGFQFGGGRPQPRGYHWETRSPNGSSSFSISMVSTNGGPMRVTNNRGHGGREFGDPAMAEVQNDFQDLIQTIVGIRQQRPMQNRGMPPGGPIPPGFVLGMGGPHQPPGQAGVPLTGLLGSILQGFGGGAVFQRMMDPTNASHGDAVFTQEALDQIVSQLMEQNQGSNAPAPAPEAAIQSLPKKNVQKDMLDDRGKAECSICMDPVELGDEVTVLPCTHWFHETCITAWLKEHDTCPHCRKGISTQAEPNGSASRGSAANASQGSGGQPGRPQRRRSSAAMPGGWQSSYGGPRSPTAVDETSAGPQDIRAARQRYFSRHGTEDLQRRETQGRWSSRSTPSSSSSARRHRSDPHRSPSNNSNSGGFSGWVRSLGGGGSGG